MFMCCTPAQQNWHVTAGMLQACTSPLSNLGRQTAPCLLLLLRGKHVKGLLSGCGSWDGAAVCCVLVQQLLDQGGELFLVQLLVGARHLGKHHVDLVLGHIHAWWNGMARGMWCCGGKGGRRRGRGFVRVGIQEVHKEGGGCSLYAPADAVLAAGMALTFQTCTR